MPRFFVENTLSLGRYVLRGDDFHHLRDVLRHKPGDSVTLCDGAGNDFSARIEGYRPDGAELLLYASKANEAEPPYKVSLYQGLAKGDKMDSIIQKAVELGAWRIVPVQCRRSIVQWTAGEAAKKVGRWQKIATAAAQQCGRGLIPHVGERLDFAAAVAEAGRADVCLVAWESERHTGLRTFLESLPDPLAGSQAEPPGQARGPLISILIGPEGGFAAEEIDLALDAGFQPVSLGRRILRTETAGAAALAMLLYRYNDF